MFPTVFNGTVGDICLNRETLSEVEVSFSGVQFGVGQRRGALNGLRRNDWLVRKNSKELFQLLCFVCCLIGDHLERNGESPERFYGELDLF